MFFSQGLQVPSPDPDSVVEFKVLELRESVSFSPVLSKLYSRMYFRVLSEHDFNYSVKRDENSVTETFVSPELSVSSVLFNDGNSSRQVTSFKNLSNKRIEKDISVVALNSFTRVVVDGNRVFVDENTLLVLNSRKFRPRTQIGAATYILPYEVYVESELTFFDDTNKSVGKYSWHDLVDLNVGVYARLSIQQGQTTIETVLPLQLEAGETLRIGE
ncbi:MAG: hypothetical protein CL943_00835 [Candidatus Diapherotrites archaeon]|uniref:Uncharacterized protein n=1 Tax=Candidatus Iainarchaeum sp. TaxID=3101447 RepID=A0A2D6M080_9ARCH|nr:hypothetical protein [Candidatus Diapherotrites archaeon]